MQIVYIVLGVLAFLFLLLWLGGGYYMFRLAVRRDEKRQNHGWDEPLKQWSTVTDEDFVSMQKGEKFIKSMLSEYVSITSRDGLKLSGRVFENPARRGVFILVHGYRSEHAETAGMFVDMYHRLGFDVFAPDNTAHGESEGRTIGFDLYESEDALRWTSYLKARAGRPLQIILHGFSLGGATVMKMSDRVGKEVKFIVEDSGYTEVNSLLSATPLDPQLKVIYKKLTGLDLQDTDVRPNLERARVPILFVQGKEDKLVPADHGPYLYEFYQGPKDCLFVPGARHIESMHVDPEGYEKKLSEMIGKYID